MLQSSQKALAHLLHVGEEYTKCWELLEALLFFGYFPALGSLLKDIPVATFCESFRDKPDEVIEYSKNQELIFINLILRSEIF